MRYWKRRRSSSLVTISSCTSTPPVKVTDLVVPVNVHASTPGNQSMLPASLTTFQTSSAGRSMRTCLRMVAIGGLLAVDARTRQDQTVSELSLPELSLYADVRSTVRAARPAAAPPLLSGDL